MNFLISYISFICYLSNSLCKDTCTHFYNDFWSEILDDDDVAYLDFRKAFDMVSHKHCHTLFHMVTFGHKCRLICVQYIDKNGQYNKCHSVSCFTQDKLT